MSELADWEAVPILVAVGGAGGPMDHDFFEDCLARIEAGLEKAAPVDGVYLNAHGAGLTTRDDDLDGTCFSRIRAVVGPDVPIVAVLDLHGMITQRMVDAADILVAYRTNPHVDQPARSREAAELMFELWNGMRPRVAWHHVPMMAPSVTLGTRSQEPYGRLIDLGQARLAADSRIANVSILCGFNPADCVHNGFHVVVTARENAGVAGELAADIARHAWAARADYRLQLTPIDTAVDQVKTALRADGDSRWILADVADNPGAGARGNTVHLLRACVEAGVPEGILGLFYDPDLAEEAFEHGTGHSFVARFNRAETSAFSEPWSHEATVLNLDDLAVTPARGMLAGRKLRLGRCALLDVAGIQVAVSSIRQQITSDDYLSAIGADTSRARLFIVKSRGHFRAGFDHLVDDDHIIEVDCPALATPNLQALPWEHVLRPIYPLDPDLSWSPEDGSIAADAT